MNDLASRLERLKQRRAELLDEAKTLTMKDNHERMGQIAQALGNLKYEEMMLNKGIVTYWCTICGIVPVDAEGGYDTCAACLTKQ